MAALPVCQAGSGTNGGISRQLAEGLTRKALLPKSFSPVNPQFRRRLMTSLTLLLWITAAIGLQLAVYLAIALWRRRRAYAGLMDTGMVTDERRARIREAGSPHPRKSNDMRLHAVGDIGAAASSGHRAAGAQVYGDILEVQHLMVERVNRLVDRFLDRKEDPARKLPVRPGHGIGSGDHKRENVLGEGQRRFDVDADGAGVTDERDGRDGHFVVVRQRSRETLRPGRLAGRLAYHGVAANAEAGH